MHDYYNHEIKTFKYIYGSLKDFDISEGKAMSQGGGRILFWQNRSPVCPAIEELGHLLSCLASLISIPQ